MVIDGAEEIFVTAAHGCEVEHPYIERYKVTGGVNFGDVRVGALFVRFPAETVGTSIIGDV